MDQISLISKVPKQKCEFEFFVHTNKYDPNFQKNRSQFKISPSEGPKQQTKDLKSIFKTLNREVCSPKKPITKVNIVFVLKEVRPEMELFLNNHLRCVKSLNAISKYIPNARLTIYLIFFFCIYDQSVKKSVKL